MLYTVNTFGVKIEMFLNVRKDTHIWCQKKKMIVSATKCISIFKRMITFGVKKQMYDNI